MTTDGIFPLKVVKWLERDAAQPLSQRFLPLWQAVKEELSPLVGDSGFAALFTRCCFQCGNMFPWLTPPAGSDLRDTEFSALAVALAGKLDKQPPEIGLEASCALFAAFYDLLLQLIGEQLTVSVLDTAWSRHGFQDCPDQLPT